VSTRHITLLTFLFTTGTRERVSPRLGDFVSSCHFVGALPSCLHHHERSIGRSGVRKSPIGGLRLSLSSFCEARLGRSRVHDPPIGGVLLSYSHQLERPIGHSGARKSPIGGLRLSLSLFQEGFRLIEGLIMCFKGDESLIGGFSSCPCSAKGRCRGDSVGHQGLYGQPIGLSSPWPLCLGCGFIFLIAFYLALNFRLFCIPPSFFGCEAGVVGWPPLLYFLHLKKLLDRF
jgi:hypothetical protein